MKKRLALVCIMILSISTFLMACGGNKDEASKSQGKKTLKIMENAEVSSMDSTLSQDVPSFTEQGQVFEGLYTLNDKDQAVPAIAKDMPKLSEDQKTYTIKLRDDAKWSNGTKVTANDFIFAWKKLANPDTTAQYSFLLDGTVKNGTDVVNGKKSVDELGFKALDDYTIEIQLEQPVPYFTSLLAFNSFYPQNEDYVKEQGDKYAQSSENMIYNGPFVMKGWTNTEKAWTLEKNPEYWDKKNVKSDKIEVSVVKAPNTAVNLYDTGKLDVATLSGDYASQKSNDKDYHSELDAYVTHLKLNQELDGKKTPLANENLRKALSLAVDKESLTKKILADGSKAIYGYVPEKFVTNPETGEDFRKESGDYMKQDKAEAKSYFDKAKQELGGGEVTVELLNSDLESSKKVGEYLQSQLESALPGLKVNLKTVPKKNLLQLTREQKYEIVLSNWGPDFQDPLTFLGNYTTGNTYNASGYSSADYDKMINATSTTLTTKPEERWETFIDAEKLLIETDAAMIPLYQTAVCNLKKDTVKGIVHHNFGTSFSYKGAYVE
ncbi:peptide ABC transporter substrate-binding protein [Listeria innocua]|uniref:peptide ABC transporter substrate-binding protein n=1 Tax=Listeria innocua TaxID=1642 RepID=UPI001887A75E|nr:peptide ABC transporter substrate-binding protein [Listeria innocua]MBF2418266.1 peptide ABC transporter substrate-binding protein [Listeria innocua]